MVRNLANRPYSFLLCQRVRLVGSIWEFLEELLTTKIFKWRVKPLTWMKNILIQSDSVTCAKHFEYSISFFSQFCYHPPYRPLGANRLLPQSRIPATKITPYSYDNLVLKYGKPFGFLFSIYRYWELFPDIWKLNSRYREIIFWYREISKFPDIEKSFSDIRNWISWYREICMISRYLELISRYRKFVWYFPISRNC